MRFSWRILRYGVVGTALAVIYSFTVVIFVGGGHVHSPTLASLLAFVFVLPITYLAHRHVTFREAAPDPFQAMRFVVTAGSSFAVATGGMYLLTAILRLPYYYGIALTWVLIPAGNFVTYLVWVFRPDRPGSAAAMPAAALRGDAGVAEIDQ